MSANSPDPPARPEIVTADPPHPASEHAGESPVASIDQPAKIMRIGSMIRNLLEEARTIDLDERGRERLREIYRTSIQELATTLSGDLEDELLRLTDPFSGDRDPSGAELRVAHAQLVGWLEGLFQGIQATVFAQQMAARQQLESMRGQLPPGASGGGEGRPGTYL